MLRFYTLCSLLLFSVFSQARLPEMPLVFELSSAKKSYVAGKPLDFVLTITNRDKEKSYPIVMPGKLTSSHSMFYVKVFRQSATKTEEVATEFGYSMYGNQETKIVLLEPGKQVKIQMFFNYKRHEYGNDGRYKFLSKYLEPGNYYFQAFYNPYGIAPYDMYSYIESTKDEVAPGKLAIWKSGSPGNPCYVTITPRQTKQDLSAYGCGKSCSFCYAVEKQNWKSVARQINTNAQTINDYYLNNCYRCSDSSWYYNHKCVDYIYINPNVNASLPTIMYGQLGLKSRDSVYYFDMFFQLGKIYRTRSRLQRLIHLITRVQFKSIKTSELNYIELKHFKAAREKYKPQ